MRKYIHEFITLMLGIVGMVALGLRAGGKITILALFLSYRLLSIFLIINYSVYLTRFYYEKKILGKSINFNIFSIFFVLINMFLFIAFLGLMDFIVIAFG